MNPLSVIITIAAYFIILFTVSYIAGRKADNAGFFVGNRKSSWYVVAFAMIGSSISGVTYVSVPGMVASSSFGYLQMVLGFVAGQLIIAFILTPLFYRMNLVSIYEYLENRFGMSSYHTGAWFFFISKMLGAAVRLFLVCLTLQLLVFEPFGLPFILNVAITVALVWLYTFRGGVKSLIWTDSLKTFCLVVSVVLCICYIASDLNLSLTSMISTIADSDMSRIFFFDDINSKQYFFKQFFAGAFTMVAMTGLDQDMMQRNLSCKNFKDSQKNMITSIISQCFVILLFLMLGVLLYTFADSQGIQVDKSDKLFPVIATELLPCHCRYSVYHRTDFLRLFGSRLCIDCTHNVFHRRYSRHERQDGRRGCENPETGARGNGRNNGGHYLCVQSVEQYQRNRCRIYSGKLHIRSYPGSVCLRHLYEAASA